MGRVRENSACFSLVSRFQQDNSVVLKAFTLLTLDFAKKLSTESACGYVCVYGHKWVRVFIFRYNYTKAKSSLHLLHATKEHASFNFRRRISTRFACLERLQNIMYSLYYVYFSAALSLRS